MYLYALVSCAVTTWQSFREISKRCGIWLRRRSSQFYRGGDCGQWKQGRGCNDVCSKEEDVETDKSKAAEVDFERPVSRLFSNWEAAASHVWHLGKPSMVSFHVFSSDNFFCHNIPAVYIASADFVVKEQVKKTHTKTHFYT